MRIDVSFKYLENSEFIDNILEKGIKRIERRVQIFKKADPVHISVHLEKNPHKEQYFCRAHVYLPSRVLIAEEKGKNVSLAVNKTFSAISRQLGKLKDKIEHLKRRPPRSRDEVYS